MTNTNMNPSKIIKDFHDLYYSSRIWAYGNTKYKGITIEKLPLDLWVFQEIIYEVKPDLIIELGSFQGGSATWMGDICETFGHGHVITFEISNSVIAPSHPRVDFIKTNCLIGVATHAVKKAIGKYGSKVLVIDDASHEKDAVIKALEMYGPFVSKGSYFIVEDTHVPATKEAVEEFLLKHPEYEIDENCHKFFLTFNPNGYLKKVNLSDNQYESKE